MTNINHYASDRLLDFMDGCHTVISRTLEREYGPEWLDQAVRKHCGPNYFNRIEEMLRSSMRVVEMDKNDDEFYGVEHLWRIIDGNWSIFQLHFPYKDRAQTYLAEITELRHNLAHRRKRHNVRRSDLIRIMGNCQILLTALRSPIAESFSNTVESLSSGSTPWGGPLEGHLPPSYDMYTEFVGRPEELNDLYRWFESDQPQVLVWGYGGVGKSALAYKFARDVRDSSTEDLMAVCWVSAKQEEYVGRQTRAKPADFYDLETFKKAIWQALYTDSTIPSDLSDEVVLKQLNDIPILLIIDDFDTVQDDYALSTFLLHDVRRTAARTIFTSRQRLPAIITLDVPPFDDEELKAFLIHKSNDYNVDTNQCIDRMSTIRKITDGYPLYVDDLIHHASFYGLKEAINNWTQRNGDGARQYALRRQIEYLNNTNRSIGDVLIALSVANRGLQIVEISNIAGMTDDDTEAGVRELQRWKLVNKVDNRDADAPSFQMNNNTNRLVQQTFSKDSRITTYNHAFRSLTGERVPEAMKAAIGRIVNQVKRHLKDGDFRNAEDYLLENMKRDLANSSDLYGVLGWLYASQPVTNYGKSAKMAFENAHRLGASKIDTYYHWLNLEKEFAENMIERTFDDSIDDDLIAAQWKIVEDVALKGIERCGSSQLLHYWAGYGASREAKSKARIASFSYATAAYRRAIDSFEKALAAPVSDVATIPSGTIYRGLVLAYEGFDDYDSVKQTMKLWHSSAGSEYIFEQECRRLLQTRSQLRNNPELMAMLR